ncbi:hypothetical protein AALB64_00100 [Lachnospiraceae bacterium 45-P1]
MPDEEGDTTVTKLRITRYDLDGQGNVRNYPWYVEIQNGKGFAAENSNGGIYCQKSSYVCEKSAKLFLGDKDMFILFCKANSYIQAFEQEVAFRRNRVGNFASLYRLIQEDMQELVGVQEEIFSLLSMEKTLPKAG